MSAGAPKPVGTIDGSPAVLPRIIRGRSYPKNFGIIVRTAAEGKKVADLHNDIRELEDKWKTIFKQLKETKSPDKILSEIDKTSTIQAFTDFQNLYGLDIKRDYLGTIRPQGASYDAGAVESA